MTSYELHYQRALNQSHILPNILNGAKTGIVSQFIADIVLSFLAYNNEIVQNDIKISEIASYYAAATSGALIGFLSIYMDTFAIILFSNIAYAFVYNLVNSQINNQNFQLNSLEIVFDTGVTLILIYSFDPVAHNQYLRFQEKKYLYHPLHPRMDRSLTQNIFFIILINTYGFLKIKKDKF